MPEFHEDDWVPVHCSECSYLVGYYEFDGEARGEVVCEACFHEKCRAARREARDDG